MLGVSQEDTPKAGYFGLDKSWLSELVEAALREVSSQSAQFVHLFQDFLEEKEQHG